jgi:hypothetical protein
MSDSAGPIRAPLGNAASEVSAEEFGARLYRPRWEWARERGPLKVLQLLDEVGSRHLASIEPAHLAALWEEAAATPNSLALDLFRHFPRAVQERIGWDVAFGHFLKIRKASYALKQVGLFPDPLRSMAEERMLQDWSQSPEVWLSLSGQSPERLRRRVPAQAIRAGWKTFSNDSFSSKVRLLAQTPADLLLHLDAQEVEDALLRATVRRGGPTQLSAFEGLPERFATPRVADAALRAFRGIDTAQAADRSLGTLSRLPAGILRVIPPEEVHALWHSLAEGEPLLALRALASLSAPHAPPLKPEEVEDLWKRATSQSGPTMQDIDTLWKLPPRLRPWLDEARLRGAVRTAIRRAGSLSALGALAELSPDLQARLLESEMVSLLARTPTSEVREWMGQQTAQMERGESVPASLFRAVFARMVFQSPRSALHWLAMQGPAARALVPPEVRMRAWRAWLASDPVGEKPEELGRALAWAGVDLEAHGLGPSEPRQVAPAELRPADLEAEIAEAVLNELELRSVASHHLIRRLDARLLAGVTREKVHAMWSGLIEGRGRKALDLLESLPEFCRPVPTPADLAVLLASGDAETRLRAIRLASLAGGARGERGELGGHSGAGEHGGPGGHGGVGERGRPGDHGESPAQIGGEPHRTGPRPSR